MLRDEKDIIRLEEVADGSWPRVVWQSLLPDYKTLCTHIILLHCWSKIIFSCFSHISTRLAQYLLFIFSSLEFINVPNTTVPYCHMYSYICTYIYKCAVLSCSVMSNSLWPQGLQSARLLHPWGFSRQEYWSGWPGPPPGCLLNPGIKLKSPAKQADSLPSEPPGKPILPLPGCNFS